MFIGVINQLTSGGHAVCWLVVPQMHVPSEKSMLNSPRCCAAPWNQRDPICSPFELASRKCHQRGWNSISILFGSLSFMIWMFQWAKVHPIITCPGFGRISGGAWELKLWLKAWDWRRWMQGIQPLVSDSDGLWVSKKFRPLRNHRKPQVRTAWTAATHSGLFLTFMTFANFVPSHLWVRARLLSHLPRVFLRAWTAAASAPVLAHEPRANQCERFTALNKAVHFKLFWTWHQPTPWAPSGHFPMMFFDATFPAALPPSSSLRCSEVQWIWLQTIGLSRDHPIQISMKTDVNVARSSRLQPSLSMPHAQKINLWYHGKTSGKSTIAMGNLRFIDDFPTLKQRDVSQIPIVILFGGYINETG